LIICIVLYRKNQREKERAKVEKGMELEANGGVTNANNNTYN